MTCVFLGISLGILYDFLNVFLTFFLRNWRRFFLIPRFDSFGYRLNFFLAYQFCFFRIPRVFLSVEMPCVFGGISLGILYDFLNVFLTFFLRNWRRFFLIPRFDSFGYRLNFFLAYQFCFFRIP